MKILLANTTCKVGGVSTFLLALRAALVSLGHHCELFFFEHGTMDAHLPADVPVRFGTLADCVRIVARERFDVVHANNVDWSTGISAVRATGAKLILTAHKARESAWTYGWTTANCDALAAVSGGVRDALQPYTDLPVHVVHNGVDTTRFSPAPAPPTPPIVAWIGRSTSPLKGFDLFAAVAPALRAAGLRVWVMDQHGPERAAATYPGAAAAMHAIAERWDAVPYDAMPQLYREVAASGGCILSTSRAEGLPLTLVEAQACGALVVASDVRGNNECVSAGHGGLLFPLEMAPDRLAATIVDLLRDRDAVAARQAKAVAYAREHFSLERLASDYLKLYRGAPAAGAGALAARLQARLRLSPLVHWRPYLDQRWGVGQRQFETALELFAEGEAPLGAAVARVALRTAPTLPFKPRRLARLVRAMTARGAQPPTPAWRPAARARGRSSG